MMNLYLFVLYVIFKNNIAFLLTTDTGNAGSSPHVARWFFNDVP